MGEIWKPHVAAATVVHRDGAFLMVEEIIDGRQVLNQPAGHLDPGETLVDAARRETLEETGWTVSIESLLGVYLLETREAGKTFLRFCFQATPLEHDPGRELDKEIVTIHWLTRAEIEAQRAQLRSPLVLAAIDAFDSGVRYPLDALHDTFHE